MIKDVLNIVRLISCEIISINKKSNDWENSIYIDFRINKSYYKLYYNQTTDSITTFLFNGATNYNKGSEERHFSLRGISSFDNILQCYRMIRGNLITADDSFELNRPQTVDELNSLIRISKINVINE